MDFNIEIRKKQLESLNQLISTSSKKVKSVLKYLEWTQENVEKEDPRVPCPINPQHSVNPAPESWTNHLEKCVAKLEGYGPKEVFLSESTSNPTQSIYIDRNKKIELVTKELAEKGTLRLAWNGFDPDPRTSDRLISTFSPDERLIFYNYCVQNSSGPEPPPEFTTFCNKKQDEEKPFSYEELLAKDRDSKRRRAKYKSVHINKKNHTEVIREVINGQMEEYKEWIIAQEKKNEDNSENYRSSEEKRDEQERPHSSISRNSNHSSSSRSTIRRYERSREQSRRDTSRDRYYKSKRHRSDERSHRESPYRHSFKDDRYRNNRERRHNSREGRTRRDDYARK